MSFLPAVHGLPIEIVNMVNEAYFLHLLLTDPGSVIPPGKSLLSMLVQANFKPRDDGHGASGSGDGGKKKDAHEAMVDRVKEVAHRAFWAEALEALSSPLPAVQIPRLKRLYMDLYEALQPLFPPAHPVLVALSSPLPPTSSPLLSTLVLLKEIVKGMRQRCAPVRDEALDALDLQLAHPPPPPPPQPSSTSAVPSDEQRHPSAPSQDDSASLQTDSHTNSEQQAPPPPPPSNPLASFVLEKIRAILDVAEDMKSDLNAFVLGAMDEDQLRAVLLKDLRKRESQLACLAWVSAVEHDAYPLGARPNEVMRMAWNEWLDDGTVQYDKDVGQAREDGSDGGEGGWARKKWMQRLVAAMGADTPVHCPFPPHPPSILGFTEPQPKKAPEVSALPPQLFFSQPALLYVQNYLQAIVIAAALRSLTRLPPPSAAAGKSATGSDFMHRVWTLLKAEVDADRGRRADEGTPEVENRDEREHTKLVNLADEVVRARRAALDASSTGAVLSAEEEERLRAAVARTLRTSDPVFILLRKRLLAALEVRVIDSFSARLDSSSSGAMSPAGGAASHGIPTRMQTGKASTTSADRLRDERAGKRMRLMLPEEYRDEQRSIARAAAVERSQSASPSVGSGNVPGFEEPVLQEAIGDAVKRIVDCLDWMWGVWAETVDF